MQVSRSLIFIALAAASAAAISANADMAAPAPAAFVMKAAQDGMTEVEAGRLALNKSQDPAIRSFAQRMVTDHGKANDELASIAGAKGIEVPMKLDPAHQGMVDALRAKSGSEFDRDYSKHMNMDHSKAIALFESATKTPDAELASFAKKTLPTLKEHKELAEKLPAMPASAQSGN